MKQLFKNILSIKTRINTLFRSETSNSHNKFEYHFYGPVTFVKRSPKKIKSKN